MKTKLLSILVMLFCANMSIKAQEVSRINNLHISIDPYGYYNISLRRKTDQESKHGYDYKFKSAYGFNLAFEKENTGMTSMMFFGAPLQLIEFSFTSGKFDKYEPTNNLREDYPFPAEKNVIEGGLDLYLGWNLTNQKKLKISGYLGPGVSYIKGEEISKITPEIAAKLRLKWYISYKVGIFAGVSGRMAGLTKVNQKVTVDNEETDLKYSLTRTSAFVEAGVIIDLK